jgi:tetratricopeptide (TPR) repeat protein
MEVAMRRAIVLMLVIMACGAPTLGQPSQDRERARPLVRAAWEFMRSEAWGDAVRFFLKAIEIDRQFEDAYYGLGLANMRLKKYGDAVVAYVKCRDMYQAQAGRQFSSRQDAQRYRRDRITEIDDIIRQYQQGPQTTGTQNRLRELQEQRRQIEEYIRRGNDITIGNSVPAFVSLALGSAFFRLEQWSDAEREYRAAIAADPKTGEAYNNLAVVYLTTGRLDEADRAVQAAEKTGYKVSPGLKDDIKKQRQRG